MKFGKLDLNSNLEVFKSYCRIITKNRYTTWIVTWKFLNNDEFESEYEIEVAWIVTWKFLNMLKSFLYTISKQPWIVTWKFLNIVSAGEIENLANLE